MLVDNAVYQSPFFAGSSSGSSFPEYSTDLNDIFDTELYNAFTNAAPGPASSTASGSRGSSPQHLLTPPQEALPTSFPDVHDDESGSSAFMNMFEDELKSIDTLSMSTTSPGDFLTMGGFDSPFTVPNYGVGMPPYGLSMEMSTMVGLPRLQDQVESHGIDPQLMDTPSPISDHGDDDSDEKSLPSPTTEKAQPEKPTITIAPVKVGGHGKSRKGTVQSGGVVKKSASTPIIKDKENTTTPLVLPAKKATLPKIVEKKSESENGDNEDDDDDLPQDWRPSPEVFAKMTSKEKRQLRNKISARNFRVRRKEYISTLEGDIAERDRLLDHFRTQLGSTESENLALRQEIAALKKALLDGRGGPINLPPPAPLPQQSAAEALAAAAAAANTPSSSATPLLTANTQKDLPTSPRVGASFWGGVGIGGGITPVHTTFVPELSTLVSKGLQENINPALNAQANVGNNPVNKAGLNGFEGFADMNPFTMKTLDAYRMHLWGKMAAQQHMHNHQNTSHLPSGLASSMRPHFFTGAAKNNAAIQSSSTLSALLSGKHSASSYPTPPASPQLSTKALSSSKEREAQQQREKDQQHAMLAAVAQQTILRKLGSAFWDAFTGSSSASTSNSSVAHYHTSPALDSDKIARVLEGKAVLRVVDVDTLPTPSTTPRFNSTLPVASTSALRASSPKPEPKPAPTLSAKRCSTPAECSAAALALLEESMRSLTVSKKA